MTLLAPFLAAIFALELLAALVFAVTFLRRSTDLEFGLGGLLCVAAAEHAWGSLVSAQATQPLAVLAADRMGWLGLIAAIPLSIHFGLVYRGVKQRRRWLLAPYAFAVVAAALDLAFRIPPFLQGTRLVDAGLAAVVIGIVTTPSARYAALAKELDGRTKELRTRTHELRRSYEDLRTAQEELVKKEQLAVVGELAAVIAHEVRNPLAIIANAVAGLRKQSISREDHETLLGILEEETSRLNRLVTDLLRYARPVNVQRSHFSLGDLLERALGLAKAKKKAIQIELRRESHERGLWGDANLLRQVFDNLIDNAVQAMGSIGTLTVRLRTDHQQGVDGVAVEIIDTGEGMDTQVRSRARDPFFTTRPSGTGLGLAIVDRIVDAHGGHFAIDSHAGEGTTVTVFLPHGSASDPPQARGRHAKSNTDPPASPRAVG